jgi:hypothetical protein
MTFELGDSHYLAVLDSNGEWQQKTGESEVVVDVASSSEPVTYLYLCTDGERANYSYMRTLYLAQPSKTRLCYNDSSAPAGAYVPVESADSTQVIRLLVSDITDKGWDETVSEIELADRDVPRTYIAVGKKGDSYFVQRRDNVQIQAGDTLTIDFTAEDTVQVTPQTVNFDNVDYDLTYRSTNSITRMELSLDENTYIPIPVELMREGDWLDEDYRFADGTTFSRGTRTPATGGYIEHSLPGYRLNQVTFSQDKLTASAPLLGEAPALLPHGYIALFYEADTNNDLFSFTQLIMLPKGHDGVANIPTVDLTALPGFPEWAMFNYNGDQFDGWQYGYVKALDGSFETDTETLWAKEL